MCCSQLTQYFIGVIFFPVRVGMNEEEICAGVYHSVVSHSIMWPKPDDEDEQCRRTVRW